MCSWCHAPLSQSWAKAFNLLSPSDFLFTTLSENITKLLVQKVSSCRAILVFKTVHCQQCIYFNKILVFCFILQNKKTNIRSRQWKCVCPCWKLIIIWRGSVSYRFMRVWKNDQLSEFSVGVENIQEESETRSSNKPSGAALFRPPWKQSLAQKMERTKCFLTNRSLVYCFMFSGTWHDERRALVKSTTRNCAEDELLPSQPYFSESLFYLHMIIKHMLHIYLKKCTAGGNHLNMLSRSETPFLASSGEYFLLSC